MKFNIYIAILILSSFKILAQNQNNFAIEVLFLNFELHPSEHFNAAIGEEISNSLLYNLRYTKNIFKKNKIGLNASLGFSYYQFNHNFGNLLFPGGIITTAYSNTENVNSLIGFNIEYIIKKQASLRFGSDLSVLLYNGQESELGNAGPTTEKKYVEKTINYRLYLELNISLFEYKLKRFDLGIIGGFIPSNGTKLYINQSYYKGLFIGPSLKVGW